MHPYAADLEQTQEKLQYDLYYIKNMSLLLDLAILLKTIRHGRVESEDVMKRMWFVVICVLVAVVVPAYADGHHHGYGDGKAVSCLHMC